jgi:hypothetical protein
MQAFLACVRAAAAAGARVLSRVWPDLAMRLWEIHPSIEARELAPGSTLRYVCAQWPQPQ